MSGFTPGPWEVGPVDDTVVTHLGADGVRYEIAAIDGDYNQPDEWPVMEANARLIAAAPDLLEALHGLNGILGTAESNASGTPQWEFVSSKINAAREAITKATGAAS